MAKAQFTICSTVASALRSNGYSVRDCAASVKAALDRMQSDGSRVTASAVRLGKKFVKYSETERTDYVGRVGDPALAFADFNDQIEKVSKKHSFEVTLPAGLRAWLAEFAIKPMQENPPTPANTGEKVEVKGEEVSA